MKLEVGVSNVWGGNGHNIDGHKPQINHRGQYLSATPPGFVTGHLPVHNLPLCGVCLRICFQTIGVCQVPCVTILSIAEIV